ncbi:hypothetical protein V6N12_007753 [Hibiscus sabdariffa]|uniref:DUF4283 domain-containing protein n=1 Tax=Hibiscus sabdariffa TaxID=183260 RepID=A0ABR2F2P0_9ROSI
MYNPELVQQALVSEGFGCKVSLWHESLVIVCFDFDLLVNNAWNDKAKVLDLWFEFIEPLVLYENSERVKLWLILEESTGKSSRWLLAWKTLKRKCRFDEWVSESDPSTHGTKFGISKEAGGVIECGGSINNDSIPSGGGLLDVPIVDLGPYASEESSLEVRNEQGLVISGVGLPCLDLKRTRVNTKNKKAKSVAFPGPRIFNRWRGMSEFSSLYTREEGQRKNGNKKLLSHLLDEPSPTTPVDLPRDPVKEQEDLERTNCARKEAILSLEVGEAVGFRFNEERLVVIRNLESLENIA